MRANGVTLREALERIGAAGKLRFSYSADLLPLERKVCASYERSVLGDVLTEVLRGIAVAPVIAASNHVVLAPRSAGSQAANDPRPLIPLEAVVVTASTTELASDANPFAYSVLRRRDLAQHSSIAEALNAAVPGMWAWPSSVGFTALYSARGASSFGVSSPKVFIDGIEVANPLLATQIAPDNIERIEVIRGPHGAALYGGDALSGVTNIITRHDVAGGGAARLHMRSGFAVAASDFAVGATVGQEHTVSMQLGSQAFSSALNFGLGRDGEFMPGAYARHASFDGNLRKVGARTVITGTARYFTQSAGNPAGLIFDSAFATPAPLSMQQYTLGASATVRHNDTWSHSLVLGADGYAMGRVRSDSTAPVTITDSILRAAGDGALRTTVRLNSVARFNSSTGVTTTLTFSAEHSALHEYGRINEPGLVLMLARPKSGSVGFSSQNSPNQQYEPAQDAKPFDQQRSATGLGARFDVSFQDQLFINGGLRLQRDVVDDAARGTAALPMLGASWIVRDGEVGVKVRAAYGKGVRWPELHNRYAQSVGPHGHMTRPTLAPEQQAGVEAGLDITLHDVAGIQITRYDQTASGLQQTVLLSSSQLARPSYSLQNVGEIANQGWEAQAYVRHGQLSVTSTLALTDSRVTRIADGYAGDLQPGDRILGVPARTMSLSASWSEPTWTASLGAARAFDWINYDRLALTRAQDVSGAALRNYWTRYRGHTRLRATLTRNLRRGLTFTLSGENLLDKQVGEPDNLTVVPGRTISASIRAAF